jgi:hypothetical protein
VDIRFGIRRSVDHIMTEQAQRMVAEVLAQRLGIQCEEMPEVGGDPIMLAVALSLMKRFPSDRRDNEADRIRNNPDAVRIRRVAATVGACPRCLGDDASCVECAGQGKPGYRAANPAALLAWITPPLRRLGLCVYGCNQQPNEHKR